MPNKSTHARNASQARKKLDADIQRLGMDGRSLLQAAVTEAHSRLIVLLGTYFEGFSPEQKNRIRTLIGARPIAGKSKPDKEEDVPRYWLPFNGQTWSGYGRPPEAFIAWEGTVAHTEWKKRHPEERFPRFPG